MSNLGHKYPDPQVCPLCKAGLKGARHPKGLTNYYGDHTHGNAALGVVVRGTYDGVLYFVCPHCESAFARDFGAALGLQHLSEEHAANYNTARRAQAARRG